MLAQKKSKKKEIELLDLPDHFQILGADLSLKRPGFCLLTIDKSEDLKIVDIKLMSVDNKTNNKKSHGKMLDELLDRFSKFVANASDLPIYFVREAAFVTTMNARGGQSQGSLFEVVGITNLFLYQHYDKDIIWNQIFPTTIKKLLTNNGKAEKEDVANAVSRYVGDVKFANDDESDAVAVAIAFLIQQKQLTPFYEEQKEVSDGECKRSS